MGDFDRNGCRKPQRELYRPGSGPLRKSGKPEEEVKKVSGRSSGRSMEIEKITEELKKISMSSVKTEPTIEPKKVRKPDTAIYVPKPAAQREQERLKEAEGEKKEEKKKKNDGRKRRGKGRGAGKEDAGRPEGKKAEQKDNSRFVRHGSEPRSGPPLENRMRDTKSMEPMQPPEKKGVRRGGKTLPAGFTSLPPRFQRKLMAENWGPVPLVLQEVPPPPWAVTGPDPPPRSCDEKENWRHNTATARDRAPSPQPQQLIKDWAAEVERTEQEALSRAESRESFVEPSVPLQSRERRKRKKRSSGKDRNDRSMSREGGGGRRGSLEARGSVERRHGGSGAAPQRRASHDSPRLNRNPRRESGKVEEISNWRLEKQAGILVLPKEPSPPISSSRTLYDPRAPTAPRQHYPPQFVAHRPTWYQTYADRRMELADNELQYYIATGVVVPYWDRIQMIRSYLKGVMKHMLVTELRFCQAENVEQHFWKVLYYNLIELLRKCMVEQPESREQYRALLNDIINEGTAFFEGLVAELERANKLRLEDFLNGPLCLREGLGFTGLALVAAQKLFLYLGDLARYREQANDTQNFTTARQWYMKAHQVNPKNGRPYNQLALLAIYARRKLDAVYYYMRSLMASNPLITARDSLLSLFDENRKKYEAEERKREEDLKKREKETEKKDEVERGLRKEVWIHPGGGRNVHRLCLAGGPHSSSDDLLYSSSDIEVNKRFCMSYLHVHGKFFTKIGLETLTETAVQMLKEFRALLHHSPIPLSSVRFLQLLALNMFAIEISQPKEGEGEGRGGGLESALVVSLEMFSLMVERLTQLLEDQDQGEPLSQDAATLLPPIKVWCDWLMTHVDLWNPPPSCQDFKVGPGGDCWSRLATLVSLLERINYRKDLLSTTPSQDGVAVHLPEDATLCGFTPLMANAQETVYTSRQSDAEEARLALRLQKVEFFCSVFLCGLDPPVLRLLKRPSGRADYVSLVVGQREDGASGRESEEPWVEGGEAEGEGEEGEEAEDTPRGHPKATPGEGVGGEAGEPRTRSLRDLKHSLEREYHATSHRSRLLQRTLEKEAEVVVELEVRPLYLVPDTNCFIEHLELVERLAAASPSSSPYLVAVPLVVLAELNGLSRGLKVGGLAGALVAEAARSALHLLTPSPGPSPGLSTPALRCVTARGALLPSTAFTTEHTPDLQDWKNDDKILETCVNLSRTYGAENPRNPKEEGAKGKDRLVRRVVLLTEDRNLRVKALARDLPVRTLPDFLRWAALPGNPGP